MMNVIGGVFKDFRARAYSTPMKDDMFRIAAMFEVLLDELIFMLEKVVTEMKDTSTLAGYEYFQKTKININVLINEQNILYHTTRAQASTTLYFYFSAKFTKAR